jgi:hypothetical protein
MSQREKIWEMLPSGIDPTLIAANLKLTPSERIEKMVNALAAVEKIRAAMKKAQSR